MLIFPSSIKDMKLYLGHKTAFAYWCSHDLLSRKPIKASKHAFKTPTKELIAAAFKEVDGLKIPLDIIVRDTNSRRPSMPQISWHSIGSSLPQYSFINHSAHVAFSSPEACFLQLATCLTPIGLIMAGCELCGTYAVDPNTNQLINRKKRTAIDSLKTYLNRAGTIKGSLKAKTALKYLFDNSASPMETKLALLLSLPTSMGGYGIPKPKLNEQIVTSSDNSSIPSGGSPYNELFRCDLCWPHNKLAIEYDSHLYHANNYKIDLDSTRRIRIETERIRVLSVTKQQIYNEFEFEKLAIVIARYLNYRLRITRKDFAKRRHALRRQLGFIR